MNTISINAQRTTHNAQRTTHNAQRTTHNAQRTTHNAQRTTHKPANCKIGSAKARRLSAAFPCCWLSARFLPSAADKS